MNHKKRFLKPYFLLILFSLVIFGKGVADCLAAPLEATLEQNGQRLELSISIPSPPPTSLIARIQLPSKIKIMATSPKAAKIDTKNSQIKWLIKNPSPGSLRLSVTTSPPVAASKVAAEILYRKPGDGKMSKIDAQKR